MSVEIDGWRREIDHVDEQLLDLFNRRAHCAIEVGMVKRRLKLALEVPEREAGIVARMVDINAGPLNGEAIAAIFVAVIAECRIAERAMVEG